MNVSRETFIGVNIQTHSYNDWFKR